MSSIKLSDIFRNRIADWREPKFTDEVLEKYSQNPGVVKISGGTLAGIEYEIENCRYVDEETVQFQRIFNTVWAISTDGSLRNNGKEFISKPLSGENLQLALNVLDQTLKNQNRGADANARCGIHVHINALDINSAQLLAWISLYQVFERQLYAVSGARDKNLFCLPTWAWNGNLMSAIGVLANTKDDGGQNAVLTLNNQGLKYAGMNTRTLNEHGTLEFRQMQTTKDIASVSEWVDTLIRIKLYAINSVKELPDLLVFWDKISELNTTSEYAVLLKDVFGERQEYLMLNKYWDMMAKGIIQVKESIAKYKYTLVKNKKAKGAWATAQEEPDELQVLIDDLHRQAQVRNAVPIPPPPAPEPFDVNEFRRQVDRDNIRRHQEAQQALVQRAARQAQRNADQPHLIPAPRPPRNPR